MFFVATKNPTKFIRGSVGYVLMQMYRKPDYQEQKNELMSYMEHKFDERKHIL